MLTTKMNYQKGNIIFNNFNHLIKLKKLKIIIQF
jgi:hypothetical protein